MMKLMKDDIVIAQANNISYTNFGWQIGDDMFLCDADKIYTLVEPIVVPEIISRRQLTLGLLSSGFITPLEAVNMSKRNEIPSLIQAIFDQMPEEENAVATITFNDMIEVQRKHPLLDAVRYAAGLSEEDMDEKFLAWSEL